MLRRLDRLGGHATRLECDINAMAEAFTVFVQLWFAHTPSIGENEKDAARRDAWNQYQKFVEYVASQMVGGHRFTDNLVQDTIADKDELHQGRRSVIMTIDAEHVSFLNMTYIFRHSSYSRTFKAAGCKQGFYVDPYKTLK